MFVGFLDTKLEFNAFAKDDFLFLRGLEVIPASTCVVLIVNFIFSLYVTLNKCQSILDY